MKLSGGADAVTMGSDDAANSGAARHYERAKGFAMVRQSCGRDELGDGAAAVANCVDEMSLLATSRKGRRASRAETLLKWMRRGSAVDNSCLATSTQIATCHG